MRRSRIIGRIRRTSRLASRRSAPSGSNVKIEGSIFTGREPDENRYDFDRPRFDSYSGRISWNPTRDLALQVSHGYLNSPEELEPDAKVHRTTASAIYNRAVGPMTKLVELFCLGAERHDRRRTHAIRFYSKPITNADAIPFTRDTSAWKNPDTSSCSTKSIMRKSFQYRVTQLDMCAT